jgi:hypothetical protein
LPGEETGAAIVVATMLQTAAVPGYVAARQEKVSQLF